ncbi:MAG: twin-arginine translocation signal domain-containing protein [Limnohabitans sp.]|nr:twin-arginine translocation signal domain-containing protein [Limnohabitans sp.]
MLKHGTQRRDFLQKSAALTSLSVIGTPVLICLLVIAFVPAFSVFLPRAMGY